MKMVKDDLKELNASLKAQEAKYFALNNKLTEEIKALKGIKSFEITFLPTEHLTNNDYYRNSYDKYTYREAERYYEEDGWFLFYIKEELVYQVKTDIVKEIGVQK